MRIAWLNFLRRIDKNLVRDVGVAGSNPATPPSAVAPEQQYPTMYAQVDGERFPIPALDMSGINPRYLRSVVSSERFTLRNGALVIREHKPKAKEDWGC
jgi:hypothetical protein